jgi:hypothetical protein
LIAGQGAARGDRRATGDLRDPLALAHDTCFAISAGFYGSQLRSPRRSSSGAAAAGRRLGSRLRRRAP